MLISPMASPLAPSAGQKFHLQPLYQCWSKKDKKHIGMFFFLSNNLVLLSAMIVAASSPQTSQYYKQHSLSCLLFHRWRAAILYLHCNVAVPVELLQIYTICYSKTLFIFSLYFLLVKACVLLTVHCILIFLKSVVKTK